jgi:hypothetical protein
MRENKIVIKIKCSVSDIFNFTLNPTNTPKWIASIVEEKSNESPSKLGTIYRNKNKDGIRTEYEIVEFKKNKAFTMKQKDSNYRVRYTLKSLKDGSTELTYFEWVEIGELEDPFSKGTLNKLKAIMEKNR